MDVLPRVNMVGWIKVLPGVGLYAMFERKSKWDGGEEARVMVLSDVAMHSIMSGTSYYILPGAIRRENFAPPVMYAWGSPAVTENACPGFKLKWLSMKAQKMSLSLGYILCNCKTRDFISFSSYDSCPA